MPTQKCIVKKCCSYGRYCRLHNGNEKEKEVKTIEKPRPKIRKRSKKYARKMGKYSREKNKLQKSSLNQVCAVALLRNKSQQVIQLFRNCLFHANQYHHPEGRDGDKLIPSGEGKFLCGNCHRVVEVNPSLSKELGLSSSRMGYSDKRKHLFEKKETK